MPEKMLGPKEAAMELGVSIWTIYRLVAKGDLPAVRVGRLLRIPSSAIDGYLDLRRVRPKERGLLMAVEYDKRKVRAK